MIHMRIVLAHDRNDGQAGLDGEVERALFEWEERGGRRGGAGSFGKDPERELCADLIS